MAFIDQKGPVVQLKHSATPGEVANPDALRSGEVAINSADAKMYFKGSGGSRGVLQGTKEPYWQAANSTTFPEFKASMEATVAGASLDASPTWQAMPSDLLPANFRITYCGRLNDNRVIVFYWVNGEDDYTTRRPAIIWDIEANTTVETSTTFVSRSIFTPIAFPDGTMLVSSWKTGVEAVVYDPDIDEAVEIGWAPAADWENNGCLYVGGLDRAAIVPDAGNPFTPIYDSRSNKLELIPNVIAGEGIRCGQFLPSGNVLVWRGGAERRVCIFNKDTLQFELGEQVGYWCDTGTILPDGRVLMIPYTSNATDAPRIYDESDESLVDAPGGVVYSSGGSGWYGCILLPTGHIAVSKPPASGGDGVILYDVTTGVVRTDATPSGALLAPFHVGGWTVWNPSTAGSLPQAYRTSSSSFSSDVLRSPFFATWN